MSTTEGSSEATATEQGVNRHERPGAHHGPLAYSVTDACYQLGIGRSTVYEEIAAGRLNALKCGNRTLIPAASMEAWLDGLPSKAA